MLNSGTLWLDDSRAAKAIEELAYEGRLDLMKRVAAVDPPPPLNKHSSWSWCWRRAVKIACKRGDLSMVQWLLEPPRAKEIRSAMRHDATDLVESAALEGHMEMLAFLYEHGFKDTWRDMSIVVKLIKKGQRKSVKWLLEHENYSKRWDPHRVIDAAALVGDLEMLKYFNGLFDSVEFDGTTRKRRRVARQLDSWWEDSSVMDIAAVYGHLDVVKWLHSNRPEGCSTRAMNEAAENGHLEVVQFLHANRQEGCTTRAMDGAVRNGHFDVVQWLYKNRSEGCTKEAVEVAAREGRLEILKWLHTHQFKGCSVETLEGAINHGCLKTVYWVHVHFPHLSPREGKLWPYLSHRFEVLLFLHEHFEHVMTPDFAQSTMRSIFDINNPVAEWMEERFPVVERREY